MKRNNKRGVISSVYGAIAIFVIVIVSAVYVNAQFLGVLSSTGIDSTTEVVNRLTVVDKDNQSIVGEIYLTGVSGEPTVVVDSEKGILVQPHNPSQAESGWVNSNETVRKSQVLGGSENKIYSDNITIIAGQGNIVNSGNDNATMLGGTGNVIGTGSSRVPAVMAGGIGNKIGENQDGDVIIGGSNNTIGDNVTNSQILGGNDNTIGNDVKNAIVVGTNVGVNTNNIFVFSNDYDGFQPQSSKAFYLNVSQGIGLNGAPSTGGLNSHGGVSVGKISSRVVCNVNSVGIQGVYQSAGYECLVGCTYKSALSGKWDLFDNSTDCIDWCKNNSDKCIAPLEIVYDSTGSYCTGSITIGGMTGMHCPYLSTGDYVNTVFTFAFVDVCPSVDEAKLVSNPCLIKCPEGTIANESGTGCLRSCTGIVNDTEITFPSGTIKKLYRSNSQVCTNANNACEIFSGNYMIFKCEDQQWKRQKSETDTGWVNVVSGLSGYKYSECRLRNSDCPPNYDRSTKPEGDGGNYAVCTGWTVAGSSCQQQVKYAITGCMSGYTFAGGECHKDCTTAWGKTVKYGESVTGYRAGDVSCNAGQNNTYCEAKRLVCGENGSLGSDAYEYQYSGCVLKEYLRKDVRVNGEAYYNLEECPKARAASGTKPSDVTEGTQVGFCEEFTEYTLANNQCKGKTRYHLTGCAAGFHTGTNNLVDVCMPDCILPWKTANLQHTANNSAWSTQAIKYKATIKGYRTSSQTCPTVKRTGVTYGPTAGGLSGCENTNNWAIMECLSNGVLSGSSVYTKQTCTTTGLNDVGYNRLQPVTCAVCDSFQPYSVRTDNTCNVDAIKYKCTSCNNTCTINNVDSSCNPNYADLIAGKLSALCLKNCTFDISPSGTKTLQGYTGSKCSSGWVYNASSYTCPTSYDANTSREKWSCDDGTITRSLNLIALNGKPYLTYTQTALRPSTLVVDDKTQTGTRTIIKNEGTPHGISNTTAVNVSSRISISPYTTYFPYYLTGTSPACTLNKTYYYLKCTPDTNTTDADKDNSWVWSTNSDKCIKCSGSIPGLGQRNDNKKFPTTDSITFCYSEDTSTTCSFSCKDGTHWVPSSNGPYYKCGTSERGDCVDWYCDLDDGNLKKIHNTAMVIYKPSSNPICDTECEAITAICKYGNWVKGTASNFNLNQPVSSPYSKCNTQNGCVVGTNAPVAGACGFTGTTSCKGNKVFTDTSYANLNPTQVPSGYSAGTYSLVKHGKEYTANDKTCILSHNYYTWNCSSSSHWETIDSALKCVSDTKSVPCTTEGKPDNSTYNSYNVDVAWNSSCAWNKAINCTYKCNTGYYRNNDVCPECTAGYYCPGDETRKDCPKGSYCPLGSSGATACPGSMTTDSTRKTKKTDCYITCEAGKYLKKNESSCTKCPANSYCTGGKYYFSTSKDQGIAACTSLGSNYKYSAESSTGETSCYMSVEAGNYKTNATGNVTQGCGAGKYSAKHNSYYGSADNSCKKITAGCYGTSAGTACPTECKGRTQYSAEGASGCTTVSTGYYTTGCDGSNNKCTGQTQCEKNNYCVSGVKYACTSLGSNYTHSVAGSSVSSACYMDVSTGNYKTSATGNTTQGCGGGKYSTGHISYYGSADNSCKKISAGCYGTSAGSACPAECKGRTQYSAEGASACSTVSAGYYTTGCNGSNNKCTGQTGCVAGTYCVGGVSNACTDLGNNYIYSAAKTSAATGCYMSVSCGSYKTSSTGNTTQGCGAGKYSTKHDSYYGSADNSCKSISAGYYGSNACSATPTACPSGYKSDTGASICNKVCEPGTWLQAGAADCTPCSPGTYQSSTYTMNYGSGFTCTNCPSGYTSETGAVLDTSCFINVSGGRYKTVSTGTNTAPCGSGGNGYWSSAHKSYYKSTDACISCGAGYTCQAGGCSGSTIAEACQKDCPAQLGCAGAIHGTKCTSSATNSVVCPNTCDTVISTCDNGNWTPTPKAASGSCVRTESCTDLTLTAIPNGCNTNSCARYLGDTCPSRGTKYSVTSAKAGYYLSGNECPSCPNGTWTAEGNINKSCAACDAIAHSCAWTSRGTAANNCGFKCDTGYYYNGTARTCTQCNNGYTTQGCGTETTCKAMDIKCAAGTYLQKKKTTCTSCEAGYQCPGGTYTFSETNDQGRSQCECGKYSTGGASACTSCGAGKYSGTGANSCNTAGIGYYANSSCKQTQCPSGTTSAEGSKAVTDCYKQYIATFKENGASIGSKTLTGKQNCTSTTNCSNPTVTAPTITRTNWTVKGWSTDSGATTGTISAGGTITLSANTTYYAITSQTCDAGKYSTGGANACQNCAAGTSKGSSSTAYNTNTNVNLCVNCACGTYSANAGSTGCTSCLQSTATVAGTYQPNVGKTSCTTASNKYYTTGAKACSQTQCPAGYYCAGGKITQCGVGTYSPLGSEACTSCPTGFTTSAAGSTSLSACYKTLKATYKENGATSVGTPSNTCNVTCNASSCNSTCTVTAPSITRTKWTIKGWSTDSSATTGTVSSGGTITLSTDTTYYAITSQSCSAGKYSTGGASDCQNCAAGNSIPAGTVYNTNKSSCTSCGAGKYSAQGGTCQNISCGYYGTSETTSTPTGKQCAKSTSSTAGTYSKSGASGCTTASDGYYTTQTGACDQTKCPVGSYCAGGKIIQCPSGTTSAEGSKAVTDCYKQYIATFKENGASIGSNTLTGKKNCTSTNSCPNPTVTAPTITRTNWTIKGWNTSASETTGTVSAGGTITLSTDTTYYAITSQSCDAGKYSTGGANACQNCAAGNSSSAGTVYNTNKSSCTSCGPGKYSAQGGTCQNINCGYFGSSETTATPSGKQCAKSTSSTAGTYSQSGVSGCTTASDGYYTTQTGACEQTKCPAGSYCAGGKITQCPSGTTSAEGSKAVTSCYKKFTATFKENGATNIGSPSLIGTGYCTSITNCPNPTVTAPSITRSNWTTKGWSTDSNATTGTVSAGGTITLSANTTYYAITSQTCDAGKYSTGGANACQNCGAGNSVPAGTVYNTNKSSCTACGAGKYSTQGGACQDISCGYFGTSETTPTPSGKQCAKSTSSTAGTYSQSGVSVCTTASDGYYTTQAGACKQTKCPAGSYCAGGKITQCSAGNYCTEGSTSQTKCPSGTTSAAGATGVTSCYKQFTATFKENGATSIGSPSLIGTGYCTSTNNCPNPTVTAPSITRTNWTIVGWSTNSGAQTTSIAAGGTITLSANTTYYAITSQTCGAGKYSTGGASACQNCAAGSSVPAGTVYNTNKSSCTACGAGKYSTQGGACQDINCGYFGSSETTPTPSGKQCAKSTSSTAGTYSQSGVSVCTTASDGYYTTQAGACKQTKCPAGSYCAGGKITQCSAGNYCTEGSTTQSQCPSGTTSAAGATGVTSCYKQYTATFNKNGATSIGSTSLIGTGYCTSTTNCPNPTVTAPSIARTNGTVIGWSTNSGAQTASVTSGGTITLSKDTTYYAITKKTITGTFKKGAGVATLSKDSGTCTMWNTATTCSIEMATATCEGGYYTVTWSPANLNNISKNTTTTGTCSSCPSGTMSDGGTASVTSCYKKFIATFETNGATSVGSGTIIGKAYCTSTTNCPNPTVTAPSITKSNWTIDGWNTSSSAQAASVSVNGTITLSTDTTYYAITHKTITGTFKKGAGVASLSKDSGTCTMWNTDTSCSIDMATATCKVGYHTPAWSPTNLNNISSNTTTTGTCSSCPSGTTSAEGAKTLTGCYKQYTATFKENGATSVGSPSLTSDKVYCTIGGNCSNPTVTAPNITRNSWIVVGWSTNSGAQTTSIATGGTITLSADTTYYAITKQSCDAGKYSTGGGNACQNCAAGSSISAGTVYNTNTSSCTSCPAGKYNTTAGGTCANCTAGYYCTGGSAKTLCPSGTTSAAGATGVTSCYKQYTATFNKNGATEIGSTSLTSNKVYCTSATNCPNPTVTAPTITRSDFNIRGWNTSSTGTSASVSVGGTITLSANATYYAITDRTLTGTFSKGAGVASVTKSSDTCVIRNTATTCSITMATATCSTGYHTSVWSPTNLNNISTNKTTTATCSACTAILNSYSWTSSGTSATTCGFTCNAGYYYNGTARTCTQCPNGYNTTAGNTSTSCTPIQITCEAGKYLKKSQTTCTSCEAGYKCAGGTYTFSETKDQGREQCECGRYSTGGASTCTLCGAKKYSGTGASSCSTASTGYYANSSCSQTACTAIANSTWTSNGSTAKNCNFVCDGGYSYNSSARTCTACEVGKYTSEGNTSTACLSCTAIANSTWTTNGTSATTCGFTCNAGYTASGRNCIEIGKTITYNLNGGYWTESGTTATSARSIMYTGTVASTTPRKTPSKQGGMGVVNYMFAGWYLESAGNTRWTGDASANRTVYAKWLPFNNYSVTLNDITITIMDRNLGATASQSSCDSIMNTGACCSSTNTGPCGYHFQWGNNYGFAPNSSSNATFPNGEATTSTQATDWAGSISTYFASRFIMGTNTAWNAGATANDNLRGYTSNTDVAMQGPCPDGYHVPRLAEWDEIMNSYNVWKSTDEGISHCDGHTNTNCFKLILGLESAGGRYDSNAKVQDVGTYGHYWSSQPSEATKAYSLQFNSSSIDPQYSSNRSTASSVRCFKNTSVQNITYVTNGGSAVTSPATTVVWYITTPVTLPTPTKAGYDFAGWYLNSDFSGPEIKTNAIAADGPITLYAKWEEAVNGVKITYNLNGGYWTESGTAYKSPRVIVYTGREAGTTYRLTPSKEDIEGTKWMFNGWYTNAVGTTRWTGDTTVSRTVYAKWLPFDDYSVTLNGRTITIMDRNLGATENGTSCSTTSTGSCGYHFQYGNNYGFMPDFNSSTAFPNGEVTSYSQATDWQGHVSTYYSSKFIRSTPAWNAGATAIDDLWGQDTDTDEAMQGPCPDGYHVPRFMERGVLVEAFNARKSTSEGAAYCNGLTIDQCLSSIGQLPYGGYRNWSDIRSWEFGTDGLYASSSTNNAQDASRLLFQANRIESNEIDNRRTDGHTVRCFQNNIISTITYETNGGNVSGGPTQTIVRYLDGSRATNLPTPTKAGYRFGGWYLHPDFSGPKVTTNAIEWNKPTVTLYAKWEDNIVGGHTITYNLNGGYWTDEGTSSTSPKSITYSSTEAGTTPRKTPSKAGYMFNGWYTTVAGTTRWTGNTATDRTVYAKWLPFSDYTVTLNGVTITIADRNVGATQSGTTCSNTSTGPCGYHFQYGNNYGFAPNFLNNATFPNGEATTNTQATDWAGSVSTYFASRFIMGTNTAWNAGATANDNLRGYTSNTDVAMQGPCPDGYHVPRLAEWEKVVNSYYTWKNSSEGSTYCNGLSSGNCLESILWLPHAGYRENSNASMVPISVNDPDVTDSSIGAIGEYWSSTLNAANNARRIYFNKTNVVDDVLYAAVRAQGASVRCFKNSSVQNITYESNGGSTVAYPYNTVLWYSGTPTNLPTPIRTGATFAGWYLNSDFSGPEVKTNAISADGPITLYAKWAAGSATSCPAQGGCPVTPIGGTCETAARFCGWQNTNSTCQIDGTWDNAPQTNLCSSSAITSCPAQGGCPATDIGGTCVSASSSSACNQGQGTTSTCQANGTWNTAPQSVRCTNGITITYDLNLGYWTEEGTSSTSAKTITYTGAEVGTTSRKTPSRAGYMFDGWYLESIGTTRWLGDTTTSKTVYAKWLPFEDYSITLNGVTITIMDRNLGATNNGTICSSTNTHACGYHFQYGNNYGFAPNFSNDSTFPNGETSTNTQATNWAGSISTYFSSKFIMGQNIWNSGATMNGDNLWGYTSNTDAAMQGPCPAGYHVPRVAEWQKVVDSYNTWKSTSEGSSVCNGQNNTDCFKNVLQLPYAGHRESSNASINSIGSVGHYWASTVNADDNTKRLYFNSSVVDLQYTTVRAQGASMRCFKNSSAQSITYNANGGSVSGGPSQTVIWYSGTPTNLPTPTKAGSTFEGWYLNSDFSGPKVTTNAIEGDSAITLYAKWSGGGGGSSCPSTNGCPETPIGGTCVTAWMDGWCSNAQWATTSTCQANGTWDKTPSNVYCGNGTATSSVCSETNGCPETPIGGTCVTASDASFCTSSQNTTASTCQANGTWDNNPEANLCSSSTITSCPASGVCPATTIGGTCVTASDQNGCNGGGWSWWGGGSTTSTCQGNGTWDNTPQATFCSGSGAISTGSVITGSTSTGTITYNLNGGYWTESGTAYKSPRSITYTGIVAGTTYRKTPSRAGSMFNGWYTTTTGTTRWTGSISTDRTVYAQWLQFNDYSVTLNGVTITIMDRNLGATSSGTTCSSSSTGPCGYHFQYGNNYGFAPNFNNNSTFPNGETSTNTQATDWAGSVSTYFSSRFIMGSNSWNNGATMNGDNLWGYTSNTDAAMQGPCPAGYHVPRLAEWQKVVDSYNTWKSSTEGSTYCGSLSNPNCFESILWLPHAGHRESSNASVASIGSVGHYWASTLNEADNTKRLYFDTSVVDLQYTTVRAQGASMRCFKNSSVQNITYNTNGGSVSGGPSQTVLWYSGTPTNLPTPTKAGFTFEGWYLKSDFSGPKVTTNAIEGDSAITLYAKWSGGSTTTCPASGGCPQTAVGGQCVTAYNAPSCSTSPTTSTCQANGTWSPTPKTYLCTNGNTITYNLNGGYWTDEGTSSTSPKSITYSSTEAGTTPRKTPSKAGYMFNGWYLESAGTTRWTGDTSANRTVYAKWLPFNDYSVTLNGVTITIMDRNVGATSSGTTCSNSNTLSCGYHFQYGNNYGFAPNFLNNATFPNGEAITNITNTQATDWAGSVSTYFRCKFIIGGNTWNANATVNDDLWGKNSNTDAAMQGPCPDGYHIPRQAEWQKVLDSYNTWKSSTEGSTYCNGLSNGNCFESILRLPHAGHRENSNASMVSTYNNNNTIGAVGHYWASTLNDANNAKRMYFDTSNTVDLGGTTARALAASVRCFKDTSAQNITYNANGGSVSGGPSQTVIWYSGTPTNLPTPTRNGYTFDGWYLKSDFSGPKVTTNAIEGDSAITLYAKWSGGSSATSCPASGGCPQTAIGGTCETAARMCGWGNVTSTCQSDGTWDNAPQANLCSTGTTITSCPASGGCPETEIGGQCKTASSSWGCNRGSTTSTCQSDGTWDNAPQANLCS